MDSVYTSFDQLPVIVTAEEHTVNGGLGSAVAEVVSENKPCIVKRFGVQDRFGQSGTPDALFAEYKLTAADLADECEAALKMKG